MREPGKMFLLFAALQVLDLVSTVWFLRHGVAEANPLLRAALAWASRPVVALAIPKGFALMLALVAWRSGRTRLLGRVNLLYAAVVAWNLLAAAGGQ